MACLALALLAAAPASARTGVQYRIEGRGWGHGIGMSQYGAHGFAKRGWDARRIVEHYYQGGVVARQPDTSPSSLRVLLQSYLAPARLEMTSDGLVQQGAAQTALLAGDVVEMASVGSNLVVTRVRGAERLVLGSASGEPATIVPAVDGGARILFNADHASRGTAFRGTFTGVRFGGKVSVVNNVPFESYLRGVVPDEMPPSWHQQALRAQAVAARSYALTGLSGDYSWFDMYSDTRSQVYGGIGAEEASTDAAIAATEGQVVRVGGSGGEVARTFFFSTSGGRTAPNEHVWGSSPYSYLRSVASPYEWESPYFVWKGADVQRYTPAQIASKLSGSYSGAFRGASSTVHGSGYADAVNVRGSRGGGSIDADDFQYRMGLRSTFFRISLLTISAPNTTSPARYTTIAGRAPKAGITSVLLRSGGVTRAVRLKVSASGTWVIRTRLRATTVASISRGGIVGPAIVISVQP